MTRNRATDPATTRRAFAWTGRAACVTLCVGLVTGCSWMPAGTAPREGATRPTDDYLGTPAWETAPRRTTAARQAPEHTAPSPVREATPLESREFAMAGRALLTPVRVELHDDAFAQDEPTDYVTLIEDVDAPAVDVRSDEGAELPSELFWIGGSFDLSAPRGWLAPSGAWRAETLREAALLGRAGTWSLAIDVRSAPNTAAVWIDGKRVALTWLSRPAQTPLEPAPNAPLFADGAVLNSLRNMLTPERTGPLRRWRSRLVLERFGATPGRDAFDSPALELMAQQEEDRWRAALARLTQIDAALGRRVAHALTAVVVFEGGAPAPVWSIDGATLARFRADLLDPQLSDNEARIRAEGWLAAQASAAAWIIDDAIASRHVSVGVASLAHEPVTASAEFGGVDLRPLAPGASGALVVEASDDPTRTSIDVRIGEWRGTVYAIEQPILGAPPGVRMGPLLLEHTMSTWLDGDATSPQPEWTTAALLQRRAGGEGWDVLIECRTPVRADGEESTESDAAPNAVDVRPDSVRVWFGPGGGAHAVLRVDSRGFVVDETPGAPDGTHARSIGVRIGDDRWTALLPIPDRLTDSGGLLLIGLERTDARGVRTTWPRPVLPWQTAPGRVAVDLSAWRGLERVAPAR